MYNVDPLSYSSLYLRLNDTAWFSLVGTKRVGNRSYYLMRFVCYGDGSGNPVLKSSPVIVMTQHEFYMLYNFFQWSRVYGDPNSADFACSKLSGSSLVLEVLGYHG